MQLFAPNHLQLLNACYPPSTALPTAGPDYMPNSHELSRLTYYASNHPGKLTKLGNELEKRIKYENRKAKTGNLKGRLFLLMSLSIFRAIVIECRRDIVLLSPSLVDSVLFTLISNSSDMEIVARTASVFTTWTTSTNGHLIGADTKISKDYLAILQIFSNLGCWEHKDLETKYRTRLIGFAALTGAVNSEALYNDSAQFREQVSTILRPILIVLFQTDITVLNEQSQYVLEAPSSPYLAEFRRPTIERRAASIHVHIDGDKGPTMRDVSEASLRDLFSLLNHANAVQLGFTMRSCFENLDEIQGWTDLEHCCWLAQKIGDWSPYQYRYVVPTWLVERLMEKQEAPTTTSMHVALAAMVTTVFSSPTTLVNLSSSDIASNMTTLLLHRNSINPEDELLPAIVDAIASLGHHVYYSDQIQDLAAELIGRLVVVEIQGIYGRGHLGQKQRRSTAIRYLISALTGLIRVANKNERAIFQEKTQSSVEPKVTISKLSSTKDSDIGDHLSRRTHISPDVWQDTLSLICDEDFHVRAAYSDALVFYLLKEMPAFEESFKSRSSRREEPLQPSTDSNHVHTMGDLSSKLLNAIHAYIYILLTFPTLSIPDGNAFSSSPDTLSNTVGSSEPQHRQDICYNGQDSTRNHPIAGHHSSGSHGFKFKSHKLSLIQRLLECPLPILESSASANLADFKNAIRILVNVQEQIPIQGLLSGLPMILTLHSTALKYENEGMEQRVHALHNVVAEVLIAIAKVWEMTELEELVQYSIAQRPESHSFSEHGVLNLNEESQVTEVIYFDATTTSNTREAWSGVNMEEAVHIISSQPSIQKAIGQDKDELYRRFTSTWTAQMALRNFNCPQSPEVSHLGNGPSPLIRITPALMHIENLSLQSLSRSAKGLGVVDLREALEGRSSMSTTALGRPSSISTLEHTPSIMEDALRLIKTRSRPKRRVTPSQPGEVKEMLTRLGIGKQSSNLLKASFPALQPSNANR